MDSRQPQTDGGQLDGRIAHACSRLWFSSDVVDLTIRRIGKRYLVVGYDPCGDQCVILQSHGSLGRAERALGEMKGDRALIAKHARA
jgi:hypothetical protein